MVYTQDTPAPGRPYRLTVEALAADRVLVHSLCGREALSSTYKFDLSVTCEATGDGSLEELLLRRRAVLTWDIGSARRVFHGVIASVRLVETRDGHGGTTYRLRFVPRLWLLKRRRRSRIFQKMTVPQVVHAVLGEMGIDAHFWLAREHPIREYCTQYEESDYDFITRLLAEAGIWFTFAAGDTSNALDVGGLVPGDSMLLGDGPQYPPIGDDSAASVAALSSTVPPLYVLVQTQTAVSKLDKAWSVERRTSVRAGAASFRDYDPERPMAALEAEATSSHPFTSVVASSDLAVYDHHGPFLFPSFRFASQEPALALQSERRRASVARGESGCPHLAPGHRFALRDHPAAHLDREYAVVRVEHQGQVRPASTAQDRVYENRFEVVPAEVAHPPRKPRRRSVQVSLTAIVVGPPGEEIHTDGFGQIKVRFHWDREGRGDDTSSCWIRTMHPWAGAGFGMQMIPRVGMEVVVVFEGGDPDKPMVIGCLYNGTHPTPFRLPGQKTRSGIRTQSTPAAAGHNEISFEDAAREEQIYIRAQRDLDEVVGRNHTRSVEGDERIEVEGSRAEIVRGGLRSEIGGAVDQTVADDVRSLVHGSRIDVVVGDRDERVQGSLATRVEGRERRSVEQAAALSYRDDLTLRVRGSLTTVVGKHDAPRSLTLRAEGTARVSSTGPTEIVSDQEITLRVGNSFVRITEAGIQLGAPAVTISGRSASLGLADDGITLVTKEGGAFVIGKKLVVKTDGASLSMGKEVKIDGKQILLNSPEKAKDDPPKEPPPPTLVELVDERGEPLANQRFIVLQDDGTEVCGVTDREGRAEVFLRSGGTISFPDVSALRPA